MVRESYLLNRIVVHLFYVAVSLPQDAVAEGGNSLLFRAVEVLAVQVVFVRGQESYFALLVVLEQHLVVD